MTTISFDFDGVLAKDRQGDYGIGEHDFAVLREALDRGHAVAISTCNDIYAISDALRDAGFRVCTDIEMRYLYWPRESWGEVILVTNRKVASDLHVDDKTFRYQYGEPTAPIFELLESDRA